MSGRTGRLLERDHFDPIPLTWAALIIGLLVLFYPDAPQEQEVDPTAAPAATLERTAELTADAAFEARRAARDARLLEGVR